MHVLPRLLCLHHCCSMSWNYITKYHYLYFCNIAHVCIILFHKTLFVNLKNRLNQNKLLKRLMTTKNGQTKKRYKIIFPCVLLKTLGCCEQWRSLFKTSTIFSSTPLVCVRIVFWYLVLSSVCVLWYNHYLFGIQSNLYTNIAFAFVLLYYLRDIQLHSFYLKGLYMYATALFTTFVKQNNLQVFIIIIVIIIEYNF